MGFKWKCPHCEEVSTYNGGQIINATSKCSNPECSYHRKNIRIWKYKVGTKRAQKNVDKKKTQKQTFRFNEKDLTRASIRGIKTQLGIPEDHTKGASVQTECQDIIDYLTKIKPLLKTR